jgi:hypothetical protein
VFLLLMLCVIFMNSVFNLKYEQLNTTCLVVCRTQFLDTQFLDIALVFSLVVVSLVVVSLVVVRLFCSFPLRLHGAPEALSLSLSPSPSPKTKTPETLPLRSASFSRPLLVLLAGTLCLGKKKRALQVLLK